ncbi:hypothetical protein AX16_006266 [Volvariella volvacea WC 439]|nr:hypothetical protein AX16_006266 [Volvariella volvacea WC 439]
MNTSSIDALPPETLSHIFVSYYGLTARPQIATKALGLVCRRWRFVALGTQILWTSIKLLGDVACVARHILHINNWLARSKDLPCNVEATLWTSHGLSLIFPLRQILYPISARIRSIALLVELEELKGCLELFMQGFPQLRMLTISLLNEGLGGVGVPEGDNFSLCLTGCPQLEFVRLSPGILKLIREENLVQALPKSLKYFDQCFELQPTTVLNLLSGFRNLEDLDLEIIIYHNVVRPLPRNAGYQFSHTSLRRLGLTFTDVGIRPLFEAVRFPSLTNLTLSEIPDPAGILSSIAKASPPLESLSLHEFRVTSEELLQFFQTVSTISRLSLSDCGCFDHELISALTLSPVDSVHYLPILDHLNVREEHGVDLRVEDEDLVAFIESRWRVQLEGFSRIHYVRITGTRELTGALYERISVMKDKGLCCDMSGMDFESELTLALSALA